MRFGGLVSACNVIDVHSPTLVPPLLAIMVGDFLINVETQAAEIEISTDEPLVWTSAFGETEAIS